jgi:hypothetical protein
MGQDSYSGDDQSSVAAPADGSTGAVVSSPTYVDEQGVTHESTTTVTDGGPAYPEVPTTTVTPDGYTDAEGTQHKDMYDGSQLDVDSDGNRTVTSPDGSSETTTFTDQSTLAIGYDGATRYTAADGTTTIMTPDGTTVHMRKDGTVIPEEQAVPETGGG